MTECGIQRLALSIDYFISRIGDEIEESALPSGHCGGQHPGAALCGADSGRSADRSVHYTDHTEGGSSGTGQHRARYDEIE